MYSPLCLFWMIILSSLMFFHFHPCELWSQESFNLCVLFLDFVTFLQHVNNHEWYFFLSFSLLRPPYFQFLFNIDYFYWFFSWLYLTIFCFFSNIVSQRHPNSGDYIAGYLNFYFPFLKNVYLLMQAQNCSSAGFLEGLFLNFSSLWFKGSSI